jgi:hypothetical protein
VWVVIFGTTAIIDLIKKIKIKPIVLVNIIAALGVLGLSLVIPLFLQAPKPQTDFQVTNIHGGQVIQQQDLPLRIRGTDSSEGSSGVVWAVLVDSRGQYYIQNSQVSFQSGGTWTASNVQPLVGIVEIDFVFVDNARNSIFADKVSNGDFKAFIQLPDNSRILTTVSITSLATQSV